jgi:hypothetical protein
MFASLVASVSADQPVPPGRVSFNRDIRPVLSDMCFHCHGFDPTSRKAGLRLDVRDEALKPTKSGFIPIVPGKPDESEIILRIADTQDPMPPAEAHKTLTAAQKDLLRRWVAEGAVYEAHWAYVPLTRPPVPQWKRPSDRRLCPGNARGQTHRTFAGGTEGETTAPTFARPHRIAADARGSGRVQCGHDGASLRDAG